MPNQNGTHATELNELRMTMGDACYLVTGVTRWFTHGYQTELHHIWDLHGYDLAAGRHEAELTTASYDTAADARGEANAIARQLVREKRSPGHCPPTELVTADARGALVALAALNEELTAPSKFVADNHNGRSFADDLLIGCGELAAFIFGEDTERNRRACYYLVEKSRVPTARLKSRIATRKSWIEIWLNEQLSRGGFTGPANDNAPSDDEGGN